MTQTVLAVVVVVVVVVVVAAVVARVFADQRVSRREVVSPSPPTVVPNLVRENY